MKKIMFTFFLAFLSLGLQAKTLHDFKMKTEKGEEMSFDQYKGSVVLLVNIATKCGYTPQLDDLEKLSQEYKDKDFVIVGIPSNDFGGQTPESSEDAAKFCRLKYGVTFPILEKVVVKGEDKTELFKWIQSARSDKKEIAWNFEKFLFDKKGLLQTNYGSKQKPLDKELKSKIDSLL